MGTAMRSIRECPSEATQRGDMRKRGQTTRDEHPSRHYGSEGWEFESLRARQRNVWFRLMRDFLAPAVG